MNEIKTIEADIKLNEEKPVDELIDIADIYEYMKEGSIKSLSLTMSEGAISITLVVDANTELAEMAESLYKDFSADIKVY
jgi:hypothetical protein